MKVKKNNNTQTHIKLQQVIITPQKPSIQIFISPKLRAHLVSQNAANLAEGWHLYPVLVQLRPHGTDLLFCKIDWKKNNVSVCMH
jgi:hypothetical protein